MNTFKSYLFKNNKLKWSNENFETLPRIITINPHKSKKNWFFRKYIYTTTNQRH